MTDAEAKADALQQATFIRIGITLVAILLAALIALVLTRSITRRVAPLSAKAHEVATIQLPALVEACATHAVKPCCRGQAHRGRRGSDELAELARAFNAMQATLVDVAHEQVEVLRRGVSDIFVTMARRNRSLIDRQLAMLDEFEAEVDDPDVLSNYYQLDHMATRMRRNSESLLVLANAEPKRRRVKATEIDDVVRAAIGEVEDYRADRGRGARAPAGARQRRRRRVAPAGRAARQRLPRSSPPDSRVAVSGRSPATLHARDRRLGRRHQQRAPGRAQRPPRASPRSSVCRSSRPRHVRRLAARRRSTARRYASSRRRRVSWSRSCCRHPVRADRREPRCSHQPASNGHRDRGAGPAR